MIPDPIPIVFYKEEGSGNEPVKEWLLSLDKASRKEIGNDLRTIQIGWPLGMPLVRSLGGGSLSYFKWNSPGPF